MGTREYALAWRRTQGPRKGKAYTDASRFGTPTIRRVAYLPERGSWAAPLPDLSTPAINHRIRIGAHMFRVAISEVQRDVEREPDTHLVQIAIYYGQQPLAPH